MRQVLPLAPEGVTNRDGTEKQDCELNAAKRLLVKLRKTHPTLSFVAVGEGLHSNQPFITLSMVFFILNLLVFYVHQIRELTDRYYHRLRYEKFTSRMKFWNQLRCTFRILLFHSWEHMFNYLLDPPLLKPL